MSLKIGLVGRLCGTGEIRLFTGESDGSRGGSMHDKLSAVAEPERVFKLVHDAWETRRAGG